jgi:hypothetical protein
MTEFHMDGEAGLMKSEVGLALQRKHGIVSIVKPSTQHAKYIERRGQILRDAILKIRHQVKEETMVVPFSRILSEAVFCGNAMLTVNGMTPYIAVYGRTPPALPGPEQFENPDDAKLPATVGETHRIRELAVMGMVEGSATDRLRRALATKSTVSAAVQNFHLGEKVDFWRDKTTKYSSGWHGPGEVAALDRQTHGTITVRYQGHLLPVELRCIRRSLVFHAFWWEDFAPPGLATDTWRTLQQLIEQFPWRSIHTIGHVRQLTSAPFRPAVGGPNAALRARLSAAAEAFAYSALRLTTVRAVRFGRGIQTFPLARGYDFCVVLCWIPGRPSSVKMLELAADDSGSIQPERLGEHMRDMRDRESIRAIQFLCTYAEHITTVDDDEDTTRTKPSLETIKEESSQEDSATLSD